MQQNTATPIGSTAYFLPASCTTTVSYTHLDVYKRQGLELYPLEWQMIEQLNYVTDNEQVTVNGEQQAAIGLFKQLHTCLLYTSKPENVRLSASTIRMYC